MGVYDRQITSAKRLIAKQGQSATWQQIVDGAPADSSKPWLPGVAADVFNSVSMVFLPDSQTNREFIRLLTGTEVPTGSLTGLMGAVDFDPAIKDVVIRDGETLSVQKIDKLAPNGDAILYTIWFDV